MTYVQLQTHCAQAPADVIVALGFATASSSEETVRHTVPLFIPKGQEYYWSLAWQSGETEALREIADGNVRRFGTGADAAAWLLSDED